MTRKELTITKLAQLLKTAGVDKDTALNISLRLRHPGMAEQMIEWLDAHKESTPAEISQQSRKIASARRIFCE